jgi:hypothetical protein
MADKVFAPLPPVIGAAANQTATLDIPVGPRYHVLWFEVISTSGVNIASSKLSAFLGNIAVKINGRVQRSATATQLNAVQTLMGPEFSAWISDNSNPNVIVGRVHANGTAYNLQGAALTGTGQWRIRFPIFFAEPWRKQYAAGDAMAIPTSWNGPGLVGSFQVDIGCGASLSSCTAFAEWDFQKGLSDDKGNPVLLLSKIVTEAIPITAGTADITITTLPKTDVYQQISVFAPSGDTVNSIKVRANNLVIREATRGQLNAVHWGRSMSETTSEDPARLDVVFDYDDLPSSGLDMTGITDFQVIPNVTSASGGTLVILRQQYGPLA